MRLSTALVAAAALATPLAATTPAEAAPHKPDAPRAFTMAVIGDTPYGTTERAAFPRRLAEIDADPDVRMVAHVGDIKDGSSRCTTRYYRWIDDRFDHLTVPLVYTPGDNEWTDCHRLDDGRYHPIERLSTLRRVFFPRAGVTNGAPVHVSSQAGRGLPENVSFARGGAQLATLHVVGSNDDLEPWDGLGYTAPTAEQVAEERHRRKGALDQVRAAFTRARERGDRAVVLLQQADMFDPGYEPDWDISTYRPLVRTIARQSAHFDGQVYLINGDSHELNVDRPLAAGSPWLARYGVDAPAGNLQRITVNGEEDAANGWLKVTLHPSAAKALTWRLVPYAG